MENSDQFYFTKQQLIDTPSNKNGVDTAKELSYRQQAANFIQDMGQRLQLSQLCINTAIVYMHRFYVYHAFTEVHRNKVSISALFLAAKVEEQPRKLEHVIKVAHACLHKDNPQLDVRSDAYSEKAYEVVAHENVLLQTLGFVLAIEHPHTYVVKVCQLVKASKDLAQTSYLMATTSLHMTTMCLQYKPTVVACVCIHLACKWSSYMIEPCSEGRDWFYYVDRQVTLELLEKLTQDFIAILERSPHRFKRKYGKDGGICHGSRSIMDNPNQPGPSGMSSSSNGSNRSDNDNNSNAKPSASENKIGLARKDPTSAPPPSNSIAYEYCTEYDEKRPVKYESPQKTNAQTLPQPSTSSQPQPTSQPQPFSQSQPSLQPSTSASAPQSSVSTPQNAPQIPVPTSVSVPQTSFNSHSSNEFSQESSQKPSLLIKDIKTNGSKEVESIDKKPHISHSANEHVSIKKPPPEQPTSPRISKHERREKHKKHSSHSKEKSSSNHVEVPAGIKVKIRKDVINLSGVESSQKYAPPAPVKLPSQKSIKIKLPKPPPPVEAPKVEKPATPASLKLVITKDKFGSGSYSTSHKNDQRESKKRPHSSVGPDSSHKNSFESSTKYLKTEQFQKNHSGDMRHNKISKHSSHRSGIGNTPNNVASTRLQNPVASENSTFQTYPPVLNYPYPYQMTPPPPPPKLRGHSMQVGKTNSLIPALPPLPPPQPPPPPPPPEEM